MSEKLTRKEAFQGYETIALDLGKEIANHFFLNCPPPWEEETYRIWLNEMMECVDRLFSPENYPAYTKPFVDHMKFKAFEGWEDRITTIVNSVGDVSEVSHDRH